jgi:hypothetical protein
MTNNYDFQFVAPVKGAFNAVKGRALPVYAGDTDNASELGTVEDTLKALAAPDIAPANRKAMYLRELDDHLAPSLIAAMSVAERKTMDVLEGKGYEGISMTVLKIDDGGKPGYLYAIEDQTRGKILVVGEQQVGDTLTAELQKNGVTYVQASAARADEQANEWLAAGAIYRGKNGLLKSNPPIRIIECLIKAFSALSYIRCDDAMAARFSFGKLLTGEKSPPAAYVSIMKPKA